MTKEIPKVADGQGKKSGVYELGERRVKAKRSARDLRKELGKGGGLSAARKLGDCKKSLGTGSPSLELRMKTAMRNENGDARPGLRELLTGTAAQEGLSGGALCAS